MKRFFKSSFLAVVMVAAMLQVAYGQSYMRYKMKDGSFNGFYTSLIDSISHTIVNGETVSNVHYGSMVKSIPVKDIEEISFEAASPAYEGDLGEYRIYEFDNTADGFKKAYMDNRAFCIASKNGDFGANDVILLVSMYDNARMILYTDEQERVSRYFDGTNYWLLDYAPDGSVEVVDYTKENNTLNIAEFAGTKSTRALPNFSKLAKLEHFTDVHKKYAKNEYKESLILNGADVILGKCLNFVDAKRNIESNPELHSLRLIYNGLSITGDLVGLGLTLFGTISSGGLTIPLVFVELGMLYQDLEGLIKELYPDSETMEKYKDFYKDKYGISLLSLPPVDVKAKSATLKGVMGCGDGMRGEVSFEYWKFNDSENSRSAAAEVVKVVSNQYELKSEISSLEPGAWYMSLLRYVCNVQGLTLRYTSDGVDFHTLVPGAVTGDADDVTSNSATVTCEFSNASGMTCGIAYSATFANGGTEQGFVSSSSAEGEHTVSLSGLEPATEYSYYAVVQDGDNEYAGEVKTFVTQMPDLSGTWSCTETHYNMAGNPYYTTYDVVLNKDGSVRYSESQEILSSGWSFARNGNVTINITDLATMTNASGKEWHGSVDDMLDPKRITGYTCRWNANQIGSFTGEPIEFLMTR